MASKPKETPLCHILINLRTWVTPKYLNEGVKPTLLRKDLHREYGIKTLVKAEYGESCFEPKFNCVSHGNRTYIFDGKAYTYDAEKYVDLPF